MSKKTILVSGATGQQGGAVTRHLLNSGWHVKALSRNTESEKAKTLAEQGAELVQGDLNNRHSLERAVKDTYGVFSVQAPWEVGVDGETEQGKLLADVAKASGVEHFVYTSVGSADKDTGIPHFESKWKTEKHIQKLGLKATVVRPVFFMENFFMPDLQKGIQGGSLVIALKPGKPFQMIAVDDIGAMVTRAFNEPGNYVGKAVDLAGDNLAPEQIAEAFSNLNGQVVNFVELDVEKVRAFSEDMAIMYKWFNDVGYDVDISALRKQLPGLKDFKSWLSENWKL
jgi:uncharacterized protein YbjT (DUF2867 family)